ncbi:uncharacterized protein RSE6_06490 [Rhynchosporium secalis]|uniref:Uncharacterized protein n=1 Tax=Rhynchosporium secalis TaxID=38038 RepID=A0A1E1MBK1_RHYSE|nr:uncharacterized protein RSE6_06490 [Rhynchosporium secalis]
MSLDLYMPRTSRGRPAGTLFEDDSDGDRGDFDEEELERTILGMGLDFVRFGKRASRVGKESIGEKGKEKGGSKGSDLSDRADDDEESWTEHSEGSHGVALGMGFGKDEGIVLSGGLNGEDTGSSEGFGLTIDGAISDDPATSTTSTQVYVSPYSFSEDRPSTTLHPVAADRAQSSKSRIMRSPVRRKRADSFATDHGGSEESDIGNGEPSSRFGGFGGRRLRGRRASTLDVVPFPELDSAGGDVAMERNGWGATMQRFDTDVAMERRGTGVAMERTVSHRYSRSDTITQSTRPRPLSGSSYRGTEMLGGGSGLGFGMGMDSSTGGPRRDNFTRPQRDSASGDLGLSSALDMATGAAPRRGGVAMERGGEAKTIRSDDTTRSYSLTSRSLPTRRRRSTVVARPRLELGSNTTTATGTAREGSGTRTGDDDDDGDKKESITAQFLDF